MRDEFTIRWANGTFRGDDYVYDPDSPTKGLPVPPGWRGVTLEEVRQIRAIDPEAHVEGWYVNQAGTPWSFYARNTEQNLYLGWVMGREVNQYYDDRADHLALWVPDPVYALIGDVEDSLAEADAQTDDWGMPLRKEEG